VKEKGKRWGITPNLWRGYKLRVNLLGEIKIKESRMYAFCGIVKDFIKLFCGVDIDNL
jgi:hypothetical protein